MSVREWFPEIDEIEDESLRDGCAAVLEQCITEGGWTDPVDLPFIPALHGTRFDNITHTRDVLAVALAMASALEGRAGTPIPADHVRVAALLHDASKWIEFAPSANGAPHALSARGEELAHPTYAVVKAIEQGLPEEIVNAIAAHTPFNAIPARSVVAVLVHHADMVVMDAALLETGRPTACKVLRSALP